MQITGAAYFLNSSLITMRVTRSSYCLNSSLKSMQVTGALYCLDSSLKIMQVTGALYCLDSSLKIMQVTGAAYCLNSSFKPCKLLELHTAYSSLRQKSVPTGPLQRIKIYRWKLFIQLFYFHLKTECEYIKLFSTVVFQVHKRRSRDGCVV